MTITDNSNKKTPAIAEAEPAMQDIPLDPEMPFSISSPSYPQPGAIAHPVTAPTHYVTDYTVPMGAAQQYNVSADDYNASQMQKQRRNRCLIGGSLVCTVLVFIIPLILFLVIFFVMRADFNRNVANMGFRL